MEKQTSLQEKQKVPWYAYIVLLLTIIILSGIFSGSETPLKALDFNNLTGDFGVLGKVAGESDITLARDFKGIGGSGAKEGVLLAISVAPAIIVAFGIIEVCMDYKGLLAAQKIFNPIMKPLMGLPGAAAVALVTSLTSSDAGAGMIKSLAEEKYIDGKQQVIFTSFQLLAPSVLINFFALGITLEPYITKPISIALLVIIIMKFVGAGLSRILVKFMYKEEASI